jgi:hypothetical protein
MKDIAQYYCRTWHSEEQAEAVPPRDEESLQYITDLWAQQRFFAPLWSLRMTSVEIASSQRALLAMTDVVAESVAHSAMGNSE